MVHIENIFDCKMCGHCCLGEGGIVVSPKDLTRLLDHLHMSAEDFEAQYGERRGGKLMIRVDKHREGMPCVFFEMGKGCGVHEAKPDICRAWPFFRGNLVDSESLEMAKEFCPGIRQDVSHAEFAAAGIAALKDEGLLAKDVQTEARALIVPELL